jgi:hypothetical protein
MTCMARPEYSDLRPAPMRAQPAPIGYRVSPTHRL